ESLTSDKVTKSQSLQVPSVIGLLLNLPQKCKEEEEAKLRQILHKLEALCQQELLGLNPEAVIEAGEIYLFTSCSLFPVERNFKYDHLRRQREIEAFLCLPLSSVHGCLLPPDSIL